MKRQVVRVECPVAAPVVADPVDIDRDHDFLYEIAFWKLTAGFLLACFVLTTFFWAVTARQLAHAMVILEHRR